MAHKFEWVWLRAAVVAAALASAPVAGGASESIVGDWASGKSCSVGRVSIGPLSLRQEELGCRFATVSRSGDVVTWRGECTLAAESPESASYFPAKVVARLRGQTLNIIVNDGVLGEFDGHIGPLHRCGAHSTGERPERSTDRVGSVLPLKVGAFVQVANSCIDPPMSAISVYDGMGMTLGHDYCSFERTTPAAGGAFHIEESCTILQAGIEQRRRVTLRPTNELSFTEQSADSAEFKYRWCGSKFEDLFSG